MIPIMGFAARSVSGPTPIAQSLFHHLVPTRCGSRMASRGPDPGSDHRAAYAAAARRRHSQPRTTDEVRCEMDMGNKEMTTNE